MKCPVCGTWNKAYLPKCVSCGAALENNTNTSADWEDRLQNKKPFLRIVEYDESESSEALETDPGAKAGPYDPEKIDQVQVAEELEALKRRRESGAQRIREMVDEQKKLVRDTVTAGTIIRPISESEDIERRIAENRRKQAERRYTENTEEQNLSEDSDESETADVSDDSAEPIIVYDDADEDAPYYFDGYVPEDEDPDRSNNSVPHRIEYNRSGRKDVSQRSSRSPRKKQKSGHFFRNFIIGLLVFAGSVAVSMVAGNYIAKRFILQQQLQVRRDNNTTMNVEETTVTNDGVEYPAHTLTIYGKENATVYLKETGNSYVIANGSMSVTIPDYMWYDTDTSTYATAAMDDEVSVTITPYIRYSQEGEQYELDPVHYTVTAPVSPVYLLNPSATRVTVGVSIFEVRINVTKGSTVIIDGTNVSTLIRDTGNVSKNVQVLPIGENVINISVKTKYCRENKMEVVLYREPQEIPLELSPTVITEWNYENDNELYQASISGTTLPGADITIESPYENLEYNKETGEFTFRPLFYTLGDTDIVIRASYPNRKDSVITHTVYYMPTPEVYTRKAWGLADGYSDLINYIQLRIGQIYMGEGIITRIVSTSPQMAVMDIGENGIEKEVMLENSSKTTWKVGQRYRIYGDVYGLYGSMPRLTVRYTYDADTVK